MALSPEAQAVLYTIAYTAQFNYPLSADEVYTRLIWRLVKNQAALFALPLSKRTVLQALTELSDLGVVVHRGKWWTVLGAEAGFTQRAVRESRSREKWQEVERFVEMAQKIPWITSVYVTGSLAMNNVSADDDVDFLIVTQANRLWLTRLWVTWQAWRQGKRRSWQGEEKNSWCFNLWLEERQIGLFSEQQSIYTAYEVAQATLVFDRAKRGNLLRSQNPWVAQFLPLLPPHKATPTGGKNLTNSSGVSALLLTTINSFAFLAQYLYMLPHMSRESVSHSAALFHPRDTESWIFARWHAILQVCHTKL